MYARTIIKRNVKLVFMTVIAICKKDEFYILFRLLALFWIVKGQISACNSIMLHRQSIKQIQSELKKETT